MGGIEKHPAEDSVNPEQDGTGRLGRRRQALCRRSLCAVIFPNSRTGIEDGHSKGFCGKKAKIQENSKPAIPRKGLTNRKENIGVTFFIFFNNHYSLLKSLTYI